MTYKEIQDLIKLVSKSDLSEVKISTEAIDLTIRTNNYAKQGNVVVAPAAAPMTVSAPAPSAPAAVAAPAVAAASTTAGDAGSGEEASGNYLEIRSPIVGTFYRSSSPDKPPYKKVGDSVADGEVVCIVEAMKLFNEIESEVKGKIVKVLVEDATPVEYDQVLFLVDPS